MARPKKDVGHIYYYIDREVKEKLDKYREEVGQTNTLTVEWILKKYLDEYEATKMIK